MGAFCMATQHTAMVLRTKLHALPCCLGPYASQGAADKASAPACLHPLGFLLILEMQTPCGSIGKSPSPGGGALIMPFLYF